VHIPDSLTALIAVSTNAAKGGRSNTSGAVGVYFHEKSGRWAAQIAIGRGEKKHIGLFDSVAEAAEGRKAFIAALAVNPVSKKKPSKSGFPGVYLNDKSGRWDAQVRLDNRKKSIGLFDTPKDASEAREAYLARRKTAGAMTEAA
jgi:AP2 domain